MFILCKNVYAYAYIHAWFITCSMYIHILYVYMYIFMAILSRLSTIFKLPRRLCISWFVGWFVGSPTSTMELTRMGKSKCSDRSMQVWPPFALSGNYDRPTDWRVVGPTNRRAEGLHFQNRFDYFITSKLWKTYYTPARDKLKYKAAEKKAEKWFQLERNQLIDHKYKLFFHILVDK